MWGVVETNCLDEGARGEGRGVWKLGIFMVCLPIELSPPFQCRNPLYGLGVMGTCNLYIIITL